MVCQQGNQYIILARHEDVSCPDFFKLGDRYALLCISHERGARIYLGEWNNSQFHPETHQRMNFPGGTCFAPESLLDDKGRRIMWAWVLDRRKELHITDFTNPPPYGWSGIMTLPRVLSLDDDETLRIEPIEELERLRLREGQKSNIALDDGRTMLDALDKAVDSDRMASGVAQAIGQRLSAEDIATLLSWYRSETGDRIRRLDKAALSDSAYREQMRTEVKFDQDTTGTELGGSSGTQ